MAETKIQWADFTERSSATNQPQCANEVLSFSFVANTFWFIVKTIMTWFAERNAVVDIEPQRRVIGKVVNVMSVEIATAIVAAKLTREAVAEEYIVSPLFVFCRLAQTTANMVQSVFVTVARWPFERTHAAHFANSLARFWRVFFARPVAASALSRLAHLLAGLSTHSFALHRRDEVRPKGLKARFYAIRFGHAVWVSLPALALATFGRQSVMSRAIHVEGRDGFPAFAFGAMLQSGQPPGLVVGLADVEPLGGHLDTTGATSHVIVSMCERAI